MFPLGTPFLRMVAISRVLFHYSLLYAPCSPSCFFVWTSVSPAPTMSHAATSTNSCSSSEPRSQEMFFKSPSVMGPEASDTNRAFTTQLRFSWDVRKVPWACAVGAQLPYVKAVTRPCKFYDHTYDNNSNKIGIVTEVNS